MPRKRVLSQSPDPDGPAPKKTKVTTGKASTNTTKATKATVAKTTALEFDTSEDGLKAGAKPSARKPAGRQARAGRPAARGRKKATGKAHAETGKQGKYQPVTPSREKRQKNAKTSGGEANPDNDGTEAKDGGPATAMETGDNIVVSLGPSDIEEGTTYIPSPAEFCPASAAASYAGGATIQGRAFEGITSAHPGDAAGEEDATTTTVPLRPTDSCGLRGAGPRLGRNSDLSSCDPENADDEDPITAAAPSKSIQWQRPVPSGRMATGTKASPGALPKPLLSKPTDVLSTIEKRSSSSSLQGVNTHGLRVNEPLSEVDATHLPLQPSRQHDTTASVGVATEQPFLPPDSQTMTFGADVKHEETLEPFGHNTAPVHTITDGPGSLRKKPDVTVDMDLGQLPKNIFSSIERFLNDDLPPTSNQGLWLRGVQCGIGHGLATLKSVILEEVEHNGFMFGRPFPLDPGQTRAEQRRAIEGNVFFDRLVAKLAGDTFMAAQSQAAVIRRCNASNAGPSAAPVPPSPVAYGAPAAHLNPGSTPTPPFLPRFATNPMSAGGPTAQGPRDPQVSPSFPRPAVGPSTNLSTNATATPNYGVGDRTQPDNAASLEFAAVPDGLPPQPTVWRGGEFPRASPQLTTTQDGRAVIRMQRRQE